MVSKIEKNISDHSEFMKAKEELEKWIKNARESVQECVGEGDLPWIQNKVQALNKVAERMPEGKFDLASSRYP